MNREKARESMMRISTKTRYGMRLMIDIAQNQGGGRVALKDVAERQGVSKKYLEQVVAPLVSAGLLGVTRGTQGGYHLSRPPQEITLADIVGASEDGLELLVCTVDSDACIRADGCPSRQIWGGLEGAMRAYLEGQTLAEVAHIGNGSCAAAGGSNGNGGDNVSSNGGVRSASARSKGNATASNTPADPA